MRTVHFLLFTIMALEQGASASEKAMPMASRAYDSLYAQFMRLSPDEMKVANVHSLALRRDVGTFMLQDGQLYLCSSVAGRVCGAVFQGTGRFSMTPPTDIERQQLSRFHNVESLNEEFSLLFLLFADTTAEELSGRVKFGKGIIPEEAVDFVVSALQYKSDEDKRYFDAPFMRAFLNRERNDLFFAHFGGGGRRPMYFAIDPYEEEEVSFGRRNTKADDPVHEVVNQFHSTEQRARKETFVRGLKDRITINKYVMDVTIKDNLDFSANAKVLFNSLTSGQEWLDFELYQGLEVDSVFWKPRISADFHKGEDHGAVWVRSSSPLAAGQLCSLQVYYHGDMLHKDELAWITIRSSIGWYPHSGIWKRTHFDLTFHTPSELKFTSIGQRKSLIEQDDVTTTRWVTRFPTRNASFNIGYFKESVINDERIPPVSVFIAETGHRRIGAALMQAEILSGRNMDEQVGGDIANSLSFFQEVYGKCPVDQLYATEVPGRHGEAFPGLIHLSWTTYQRTDETGFDEFFRAHEVAHQWWPIGVDFATYHDQWLSEGFASYSGLWYMQTILRDNKKFFAMLDKWRAELLDDRNYLVGKGQEAGPIWLGYRTHTSNTPWDYSLIVYKKGAWVLHMLRNMLLDLTTMNDDRFKGLMRDFYSTFLGKEASTTDFERIVSRHANEDMGWFFNQWVYGTKVPKYRFAYKTAKTTEGKFRVTCRVEQEGVPDSFKMYIPLLVKFDDGRFGRMRVTVTGRKTEFDLPLMPMEPEEIIFNDLHSVLCEVDNVSWD